MTHADYLKLLCISVFAGRALRGSYRKRSEIRSEFRCKDGDAGTLQSSHMLRPWPSLSHACIQVRFELGIVFF